MCVCVCTFVCVCAGGGQLVAFGSATTFHEDITAPPPAPDFIPESSSSRIGGFQPPAPAPVAYGGFQAPAPAPTSYAGEHIHRVCG